MEEQQTYPFKIAISDGLSIYEYTLDAPITYNIDDIAKVIYESFNQQPEEGKLISINFNNN